MLLMLAVAVTVLAADHVSKAMITSRLQEGAVTSEALWGFRLCRVANRRPPWHSAAGLRLMLCALLLLVAIGAVLASLLEARSARVALGAMLGGAAANLIDAAARRGITDFIDLRVWPVFNLADAAIVAGALLAAWGFAESL